jgi:hypothetical protein
VGEIAKAERGSQARPGQGRLEVHQNKRVVFGMRPLSQAVAATWVDGVGAATFGCVGFRGKGQDEVGETRPGPDSLPR